MSDHVREKIKDHCVWFLLLWLGNARFLGFFNCNFLAYVYSKSPFFDILLNI